MTQNSLKHIVLNMFLKSVLKTDLDPPNAKNLLFFERLVFCFLKKIQEITRGASDVNSADIANINNNKRNNNKKEVGDGVSEIVRRGNTRTLDNNNERRRKLRSVGLTII